MSVKAVWTGDIAFRAEDEEGHQVVIDASEEAGGKNSGSRPMELLLKSLAGCSGIDSLLFMKRMGQDISSFDVEVKQADRAEDSPRYFKSIHLHFRVGGNEIEEDKIKTAIMFGLERYCSVGASLKAKISWTFEIV